MSTGLILEGVDFAYEDTPILERINLQIPVGQFVTLLGSSGCGKSTLLRLLAGLQAPDRGSLGWNGQPIRGTSLERGIVFQDYALFPWMSVVDNIAVAIGKARPETGKATRREEAADYLRKVGLESAIGKYPFELSGGMRQRGAIARALALGSPLLLMDEPFGALDALTRARLQDELMAICAKTQATTVMVTHDVDEAVLLSDRIVMMTNGPAATIGEVLSVDLPRPRQRLELAHDAKYMDCRSAVIEFLYAKQHHPLAA